MPTRRFFLEGLECACRIGAYDHERLGSQRVIIDAEILLADGSERGCADPAFDAHILPIGQWALANWEEWEPEEMLQKTLQWARRKNAKAKSFIS